MTTTTSSFNLRRFRSVYSSTLRRNTGYFGLISVVIFLLYPVQYALEVFKSIPEWDLAGYARAVQEGAELYQFYNLYGMGKSYTGVSAFFFSVIMIIMPLVLALMLNSYMHSKKATDVYHALPVRRETLLLANAAVAMTIITVPVLLSNIAIVIMSAMKFGMQPELIGAQFVDMLGWLACALAIYAVTALVAVLSGTVFDSLMFSGVALFAIPIVEGIYMLLCAAFLRGFNIAEETITNLTLHSPTMVMIARMVVSENSGDVLYSQYVLSNNIAIAVYAVLGIILLLLAARLYHTRRSEIAETTGNSGPMPLLTKLVGTLTVGILTGMLFYSMGDESQIIYTLWAIIGSMLAYVILDVVLHRGFRHLVKSLPLGVGITAFTVIGSLLIMNGGLGFEARVPNEDKVASIYLENVESYNNNANSSFYLADESEHRLDEVVLTNPQSIQMIVDFHKDVVARNVEDNESALLDAGEHMSYQMIAIEYRMKSGARIKRMYSRFSNKTLEKLIPLQFDEEFLRQSDLLLVAPVERIRRWSLEDAYGSNSIYLTLTQQEKTQLYQAMQADRLARTYETMIQEGTPLAVLLLDVNMSEEQGDIAAVRDRPQAVREWNTISFEVTQSDLQTLSFLRDKQLLEQIAPDLADCNGVIVAREGYRYPSNQMLLFISARSTMERARLTELLELENSIDKEIRDDEYMPHENYEKYENYQKYKDYANYALIDAAEIAVLAKGVVSVQRSDSPHVWATFFFEGNANGTQVMIDYNRLPPEMQSKLLKGRNLVGGLPESYYYTSEDGTITTEAVEEIA